ncbi:MAG: hypothetical protein HQM16_07475 [Deltaproteobacteria bacterium]|nr:hypothetical protein [Deltaproteobacteria bacterium]
MTLNNNNRALIKKQIKDILTSDQCESRLSEITGDPQMSTINALMTFLISPDPAIKNRTIQALALVVSKIAGQDIEQARTIMRRLFWSLNEESGAVGWGAAEAIGEILATNDQLAAEYHGILPTFINPEISYLEHDPLLKEVLLGIERLGHKRPDLIKDVKPLLEHFLTKEDAEFKKIVLRILSLIK